MPLTNADFKIFIKGIYQQQSDSARTHDICIPLGSNLFSKKETLNILKSFNIDPKKVKKIVSLNEDGHFVVDGIKSNNVFTSEEACSADEKNLFKKDQLVFIEDNDENHVKVYKIVFNEDEKLPEMMQLENLSLDEFNQHFLESGLFNEKNISDLLQSQDRNNNILSWEETYSSFFDHSSQIELAIKLAKDFNKKNLELSNNDKEYVLYYENNKAIIQDINNSSHSWELPAIDQNNDFNFINNKKFYYFAKDKNSNSWKTYEITWTTDNGKIWNSTKYKAHKLNNFLDQELSPLINPQAGFSIKEDNDGWKSLVEQELEPLKLFLISTFIKENQESADRLEIQDSDIAATLKKYEPIAELYRLVIENGKIKLSNITTKKENIIFEEPFSSVEENNYFDDKYSEVYFTVNDEKVKSWGINTEQPNYLQFAQEWSLSDFKKESTISNLVTNNYNITLNAPNLPKATIPTKPVAVSKKQLPPSIIYNAINLKFDDSRKIWLLNVVNNQGLLTKEIKLETSEDQVLGDLSTKNNNAHTVILFDKNTGEFLRAYYFDENNKKINCSHKLSDTDKRQLTLLNKKVKGKINEPTTVTPICDVSGVIDKEKKYRLIFNNEKWYVFCKDQVDKEVKAEIRLTANEISALSYLAKNDINIAIITNKDNVFKKIITSEKDIDEKKVPGNEFNKEYIATADLMKKIINILLSQNELLVPEDDGVTWKPWVAEEINNSELPPLTNSSQSPLLTNV